MARQINYALRKEKKNEEISKLSEKLQKVEESIKKETKTRKDLQKKIQDASAELENIKKEEIMNIISEKNLSTEELEKMLNVDSENVETEA